MRKLLLASAAVLCTASTVCVTTLEGESPLASNFDVSAALRPAWTTGALPKTAAPDVVGAFRFICTAGQVLADDPIVYPGQPGKSHLHQFYGNLSANAYSTYTSLRMAGGSSCNAYGDLTTAANRSAYWMPAMLDGTGKVVKPFQVAIYYKRLPATDPKCQGLGSTFGAIGKCVQLPNGLKFIFGFDMLTAKPATGGMWYNCVGAGATGGQYKNLAAIAPYCPVGAHLGAVIEAPSCWDGKNLDSANHRDHMAYKLRNGTTGQSACPADHPYVVPGFTLGAWYVVPPGGVASLSLSSDAMFPSLPKGATFHTDYFEAWDPGVKALWHAYCIDKMLNCSGGDLGNGEQLKGAYS